MFNTSIIKNNLVKVENMLQYFNNRPRLNLSVNTPDMNIVNFIFNQKKIKFLNLLYFNHDDYLKSLYAEISKKGVFIFYGKKDLFKKDIVINNLNKKILKNIKMGLVLISNPMHYLLNSSFYDFLKYRFLKFVNLEEDYLIKAITLYCINRFYYIGLNLSFRQTFINKTIENQIKLAKKILNIKKINEISSTTFHNKIYEKKKDFEKDIEKFLKDLSNL